MKISAEKKSIKISSQQSNMEFKSTMETLEFGDDIADVPENTSQKRKNGTDIDFKITGSTYCSKRFKNESTTPVHIEHKKVLSKPPLPPKPEKCSAIKLRKRDDNSSLVQRLSTQCDQLRLEIVELKDKILDERNAVRALRAQNDAEHRKAKVLLKKKYEEELLASKKTISISTKPKTNHVTSVAMPELNGVDISKLNKEISVLKKANKSLEEKLQVSYFL